MHAIASGSKAADIARIVAAMKEAKAAAAAAAASAQSVRIDCGQPHPYGICPACGRGHGFVLFQRK